MIPIKTNHSDIKVNLFEDKAPITCENFRQYVADGFFNGTMYGIPFDCDIQMVHLRNGFVEQVLGGEIDLPVIAMLGGLALKVLVPLVAGLLLRPHVTGLVNRCTPYVAGFQSGLILFMIYTAVSSSASMNRAFEYSTSYRSPSARSPARSLPSVRAWSRLSRSAARLATAAQHCGPYSRRACSSAKSA